MALQPERNRRLKIERHTSRMGEEVDRLSPLPDSLIHLIFSFLDMGSIARTAFLARRWRYLFLETPVLNFNMNEWMSYKGFPQIDSNQYTTKFQNFLSLVDKVVLEDSRNVAIKKFDLNIGNYGGHFNYWRVISWVFAALIRNVNHINLNFPVSEPLQLPHQMFTPSSNLLVLQLTSCWFNEDARIRMPDSLCTAPRIKRLHLYQVLFPGGDTNGELVLACPLLEVLDLDSCDVSNLNVLTISTPRLETLKLINVSTQEEAYCKVKTNTPKLRWLNIRADDEECILDYFMEDLSSLTRANIDVDTSQEDDVSRNTWSTSLTGILSKVHNLESLELSFTSVQILTNISEVLQRIPNLFHNLKYLRLDDPCKAPIHVLFKIMRGVPRLETLEWFSCSFSKHETWVEALPFDCIFHHLKSIKIKNFCGRANEFTFLELLLKKATALEKVDIIDVGDISDEEDLVELENKLQALPRASSTVTVNGLYV